MVLIFALIQRINCSLGMGNQQILDGLQLAEAVHQALHLIASGLKGRLPGCIAIR